MPESIRLHLAVSEIAERSIMERLDTANINLDTGFALISPAAAFASKQWAENHFAQIIDHIAEVWKLPSVIIAGRGEEEIARRVASSAHHQPRIISGLNLKELAALISLSSLFVGNDSGPMHIAAAFARPLVVIFGSSNPTVWHPWTSAPHRVVQAAQEVSAEMRIATIPVAEVAVAVDAVMQENQDRA
jgi:ADP-heptose:LPS heptosyltransferase